MLSQCIRIYGGHAGSIKAVALDEEAGLVVSSGFDTSIRLGSELLLARLIACTGCGRLILGSACPCLAGESMHKCYYDDSSHISILYSHQQSVVCMHLDLSQELLITGSKDQTAKGSKPHQICSRNDIILQSGISHRKPAYKRSIMAAR